MRNFSVQNSANSASGQYFEDLIEKSLEYYFEKGYASIEKTPEPMKPIKNLGDNRFEAVYTKRAQPDYKGVLLGGQAIIFEAKYTENDKILQSAVTDTQAQCMEHYKKMNARCFVMVCMNGIDFYRVPWDVWTGMKQIYGHKHMTKQELEKYKVQWKGQLRLLDGLELYEYK